MTFGHRGVKFVDSKAAKPRQNNQSNLRTRKMTFGHRGLKIHGQKKGGEVGGETEENVHGIPINPSFYMATAVLMALRRPIL